jgi:DNA-binding phage protein
MKNWQNKYRTKFSENLSRLITENKNDVTTIASIGNIEAKTIYRVLSDENEPKISTLVPIAKGLGIHPKELYNFDFPMEEVQK